ncbi:MAG TPA: hypothetical protein VFN10_14165 [Thermoanaerobaculia bacterium]|nr:hypothetical protein [Thermoanaerobaculia bacterium]
MRYLIALAVTALLASPAAAQSLTMGNDVVPTGVESSNFSVVRTDVDFVHPANATGTISRVTYQWSDTACANAVKIKVFRRSGDSLVLVAERGPYSTSQSTIDFSPAIAVQQGDLIGITRLTNCGAIMIFSNGVDTAGYVTFEGDLTGTTAMSDARGGAGSQLALYATGDATETVARVLPVVGSLTGSFGSNFKTQVQLFNSTPGLVTGKLVFHPEGQSGSGSDPYVTFSLANAKVLSFPDVVAATGRTGLGTMDIVVAPGAAAPLFLSRVYNDAGNNGTSGFSSEAIDPNASGNGSRVLNTGATAFLVTPLDPTRTRYNIGVRTLSEGATFTATLRDKNAVIVKKVTKSYGATWFEQRNVNDFFGTSPIGADHSIQINVTAGSVILYGSTTDNSTNDPAIQYATAQ